MSRSSRCGRIPRSGGDETTSCPSPGTLAAGAARRGRGIDAVALRCHDTLLLTPRIRQPG